MVLRLHAKNGSILNPITQLGTIIWRGERLARGRVFAESMGVRVYGGNGNGQQWRGGSMEGGRVGGVAELVRFASMSGLSVFQCYQRARIVSTVRIISVSGLSAYHDCIVSMSGLSACQDY